MTAESTVSPRYVSASLINFLINELTNSSGAYSLSEFGLRILTLPVVLAFTL